MLRLMENENDSPVELLIGNSRQVVGKDGLVPRSGEVDCLRAGAGTRSIRVLEE